MIEEEIYKNKQNMKMTLEPKLEFCYTKLTDSLEEMIGQKLSPKKFRAEKVYYSSVSVREITVFVS